MGKRILLILMIALMLTTTACSNNSESYRNDTESSEISKSEEEKETMKIKFTDGTNEVIVTLNNSKLSKSLFKQLPFSFEFKDYADNEKNGTVPEKLKVDKDFEKECPRGSLGYFAPWGKLSLYFEVAPSYPGQYILGTVDGNPDYIKKLGNLVTVEIVK